MTQDIKISTTSTTIAEEERIDAFCRTLGVALRQNKGCTSTNSAISLPISISNQGKKEQ